MNRLQQLISVVVVMALLFSLLLILPFTPTGKFDNPAIGTTGPAFWNFKDGKVTLVIDGIEARQIGSYSKENGRWVINTSDKQKIHIKVTLLSLRMQNPDGSWAMKFPRLITAPK